MTMTQRYAGMLRRHANELDHQAEPVKAACCRRAANHIDELQARIDAIACPWMPMRTAPTDGTVVMVLVQDSDVPRAARWLRGPDDPHATEYTAGPGWHMAWDGTPIPDHDGPRYWMYCPSDPDA